jgi:transcriptional regulator with XRE-family HTH domain
MEDNMALTNNNLRLERRKLGISLTKLAISAGLSPATLSEFELGKRQPWPKARADLSKVMGISEDQLFPVEKKAQF